MKKDGNNLFIRYEKECDRCCKAEDDVARYRARLRLHEDSMRSSSSSTLVLGKFGLVQFQAIFARPETGQSGP